jgi:hypothetical protein
MRGAAGFLRDFAIINGVLQSLDVRHSLRLGLAHATHEVSVAVLGFSTCF